MLIGRFPVVGDRLLCIRGGGHGISGVTKGNIYSIDPKASSANWPCIIDDFGTARNKYIWELNIADFQTLKRVNASEIEE